MKAMDGDESLSCSRKCPTTTGVREHGKESTVLSDRGKEGLEQATVTRLQEADIRLAEIANETEMSPSKETNTANTTNKSCSNENPSSVNKGNAKETGSNCEQDKGPISDTVSHSGAIATTLESEGAADRCSDFSKCVSSEATKLADVALAQTNDSSQITSIGEKVVDGVTTNSLKIELQMVSKKKLSRNKTKNAGSKLDKIIASKLAKLGGVGRTSESTFHNTQTITACSKTASFNRRTSLDSSFKFDPFSPVAHGLINLVKNTNTAKSISPLISDISDAEDEPASENFEEFVVNDVGALNLVKSECLDRNLRRFRSNDSSQGGSKVSKTVTNPLDLPLAKGSPLPQICTQGIGITAPLCLKVDTRRRGSVGSLPGPSLYQKLPDNTYKNIPVEGKLGSEPLPLCLNAFSPKYSGRRSLPYVPLRRDAATQSSDLPIRENPAKTLTNCAHNRQRRHSSDFSERLAQEIIARGLCVSVPQDLKLKGDKASDGGVGCQLAPVISSDNAVHVPLSFASVEKCSARENINSGQPGDQERTTTSSFKQAQDMKCSMVKDKDHASSSPIPVHCGESSKSWTKASKNCENKSKRLKSTKASRDQHSCANRGAAEHCISVPRVFATVSSSDSLCSSTNRANNLSDHTHLGNQVSSNFTESVQRTITPLVSESLGSSTGNNSPILDNLSLRLSETQKLAHSLSQGHYNEEALEVVTKYLRDLIFSVVEHSQLTSAVAHNIHPFLHSENIGENLLNKSNQFGKEKEFDRVPENGEPHITSAKQCECPKQVKQNVKCVHVASSHSKHGTCCDSTSQCSNAVVGNMCFNQQELRQNTEDKYNGMDAAQICNDSHLKSDKSSVDKNIMDSCTPNYLGFNIINQTRNFLSNEYQMASGLYNVLGLWNKHDKCQINSLSHINKNILSSHKISCDRQNISGSDISHQKIIPDTAEDGNLVEDVKAKCLFLRRQSLSKDKTIAENPKSKVIGWNTSITGVPCSLPLSKVSLALGTCLERAECTNSSPFSNSNSKSLSGSLINALGLEQVNENISEKLPLIIPKTNTHETNPIDFMVNKPRENFMSHCEERSSNCEPKELEEKHTNKHVVPSLLSVSATQNDSSSISIKPSTYRGRPFIPPDKFFFQIKSIHHMKLPDGQKLYACDICSGVYQRAFSLKRHYLRSHINYRHLTERDISNCGIVVGDKMAVQSGTNTKIYMQNSKIISVGSTLSQETFNCNHIVEEQCTTSDGIKTETVSNDNGILIIPCVSNGTVKLQGESTYSCEPIQDSKSESMHANISLENSSFKEVIGTTTSDIPIHFPGLYRCHTCGICFDEKDDLKSHLSNHPPTATNVVIGENNTYACNQCNATFTHKHNYLRHCASAVHNKNPVAATEETQERCLIKVHLCLYCDKGFKSAAIRKRHQGRMHKKQKGPGKRKYHACPYCSKSQKKFKDFSLLMEHMVSSHPDKYHGCVMCAIRFDSKESFNKHLETSHMKTKLKIPKPDIAESNKSTLVVDVSQTTNSDVTVNSLPVIQRVNLKETSQSSTNTLNESSMAAEKETLNENEDSINKPADLLNSVGDEFRYTCGVCQKMFTNYVNMCRHRRLAHGTVTAKTKKAKQGPKDFETASVCSSASSQNNGSSRSQSPAVVKTLAGSPAKVKAPARPQLTQQFQTVEISEKLLDPETLFYSKVASNIRENLLHHLDGKLECSDNVNKEKEPERSIAIDRPKRGEKILLKLDLVSSVALNGAPHNRMSLLAQSISSEVSKVSGRRDGLVHKVSWEKYNFPKNYDGRGDGLASYIKDMSHLDISTQLVMRQNLQRLNSEPTSPNTKDEIDNSDFDFPRGLCLMKNDVAKTESISTPSSPKPELSRTNSSPSVPSCMDVKDKSIIELDCPKSSGARRKSLSDLKVPALSSGSMQRDFPQDSALESAVELSGEWVRPRKYICGACGERFRDLYILEDHKYSVHPNVWCTHLEFEESTIAGMSFDDKSNSQLPFPGSLCRRFLNPTGALTSAIVVPPTKASESSCTKCSKVLNSLSDLHRHMLECGGDNTWMLTMVAASPSGGRRNRKWRPFGSRRRRQQGRRGMKRNIPSSPMKLPPYRARHRATDIDSIQRMISNLPAKRATRRVIQFSEDDIKTRSQATIHSNRLLRKRYKVTFAPSLPRTHHKHTIGRHRLKSSANEALKFEVKKKKCAISRVLSAASAKKHSKPLSDLPLTEPAGLVVEKSSTFSGNGLVNNISAEQTIKQVPQIEDTDTSEASSKSKEKWQSSRNVLSKKRLSVMKGKLPKTLLDKEDKSQEHIPTKSSATNAYTSSAVSEEKPAEKIGKGRGKKVVVSTKIMRKSLVSAKLRKKKSPVIPSKTHSLEAKDPSATHDILMTIVPRRSGRTASLTRDKDSAAEDKTVSSPIVDTELHLIPVPFHSASYAQEDEIKPISNASTSVAKESSNILETICAVPQEENHSEDKAKRDLTSDIDNSRKIKLVGPGKGKKIEIGNANKKTKLKKKIEPEEKKIKGKGNTHPDDQISETNICEGCGLQFDNNSAYGRHMKTCIYVKKLENMSQPSIDATNIVSHQCNKCLEVFNLHTSLVEHSKVCTLASKESEVVKRKPGRPPKIKCIQNDDLNLLTTEEIKNPVHNNSDIKMPELQKEEPVVSVKRVGRPKKIKESSDEIPVLSPASKMETTTQANFTNNEILSKVKNKVVKRNHPKEALRSITKEDTPLTELLTTAKETIFDSLDEMKTENNDVIDSQELKHTRRSKHKKYLTKMDTQSVPLIIGKKYTSEETINVDKTTPPPSLAKDDLETTKISLESTPDLQDTSCFESLSSKDDETLSKPKPNVTKKVKVDSKDDIVKNKTDAVKKNLFGLVKKSSKSFIKKHSKLPSQIDLAALQNRENVPLKSSPEGNDSCLKTKVEKVSKKTSKMGLVLSTKTIKESKESHQIDTTTTKQSNEIISKFKIKKLINKKCKQHNTLKKVTEKMTDTDTELDIKGETIIKDEFDVFLPPIKNIGIKNSKTLRKKLVPCAKNSKNNTTENSLLIVDENLAKINSYIDLDKEIQLYSETEKKKCSSKKKTKQFKVSQSEMIEENHNCDIKIVFDYKSKTIDQQLAPNTNKTSTRKTNFKKIKTLANPITACKKKKFAKIKSRRQLNLRDSTTFNIDKQNSNKGLSKENLIAGKVVNKIASQRTSDNEQSSPKICLYDSVKELENNTNMSDSSISSVDHFSKTIEAVVAGAGGSVGKNIFEKSNITSETKQNEQTILQSDTVTNTNNTLQVGAQIKISKIVSFCDEVPKDFSKSGLHNGKHVKNVHKKSNIDLVVSDVSLHHTSNTSGKAKDVAERTALKIEEDLSLSNSWIEIDEDTLPISKLKEISVARKFGLIKVEPKVLRGRGRGRWRGRGRGRGRGFKNTSEVNGGTNYPKKSLTEVDIVQELSRETPSIDIELQNLDEDSSKDTALSYDEESKLSEQVLHMGDHFSLGGNRLLRARRDQGGFRKDTASRFGRRESRARSTRCNLSYEEMYTSSDVASEADSQDFDAQQKENSTESQEKLVHNRQRYKKIKISKTKNTFLRHERRKKKSLRRWTMLSNQKKLFLEEKFKNGENDEAKTLFQVTGEVEPEDPNTVVKLKESNYLSKQKKEIIEDACHKTPNLDMKKTAPETLIKQSNMDLKIVFKVMNKKDKETLSSVNSKDKSNDALIDIQTTMAETQIAKFGNEIDSTHSIVCVAQTRLDSKETSKINLELKKMEQESKILTFVTEKKVEDLYVIEENTTIEGKAIEQTAVQDVVDSIHKDQLKKSVIKDANFIQLSITEKLQYPRQFNKDEIEGEICNIIKTNETQNVGSSAVHDVVENIHKNYLLTLSTKNLESVSDTSIKLSAMVENENCVHNELPSQSPTNCFSRQQEICDQIAVLDVVESVHQSQLKRLEDEHSKLSPNILSNEMSNKAKNESTKKEMFNTKLTNQNSKSVISPVTPMRDVNVQNVESFHTLDQVLPEYLAVSDEQTIGIRVGTAMVDTNKYQNCDLIVPETKLQKENRVLIKCDSTEKREKAINVENSVEQSTLELTKDTVTDDPELFCEACHESFTSSFNLAKHKLTSIHIQKENHTSDICDDIKASSKSFELDKTSDTIPLTGDCLRNTNNTNTQNIENKDILQNPTISINSIDNTQEQTLDDIPLSLLIKSMKGKKKSVLETSKLMSKKFGRKNNVSKIHHKTIGKHNNKTLKIVKKVNQNVFKQEKVKKLGERGNDIKINVGENIFKIPFESSFSEVKVKKSTCIDNISKDKNDPSSKNTSIQLLDVAKEKRQIVKKSNLNDENEKIKHISPKTTFGTNFEDKSANNVVKEYISYVNTSDQKNGNLNKCVETCISEETNCSAHHTVDINLCDTADTQVDISSSEINFDEVDLLNTGNTNIPNDNKFPVLVEVILDTVNEQIDLVTQELCTEQTESGLSSHVSSTIPDDIPEVENIIGDSISDTCFDQDPSFQKNWFYYDNCDTIENEMLCGFKKPTKDTMIETAQLSTFGSDPDTLLKEDSIKVNTSISHQKLCAVQQSEDLCNSESLPQANQIQDILLHSLALAEQIPLQENIQLNLSPSKEPKIQDCLSTDFDKEMSCTQDTQLVQSPESQVTEMNTCLSLAIENQSSLVLTAKIESPSSENCKIQDCFSNELDEHQSLLQASHLQDHSSKQPGIQEFVSLEFEKEHETLSLDKDKSSNYSDKEVLLSEDISAKASSLHIEEIHTPLQEEPITITFAPKESHSSHYSDTETLLSANIAVQASSQQSKVFIHSQQENIIQKPAAIELPLHLPPGLDPEVEALLSLGSEIQDRSNFWTNSEQVRSYNLPETQAHSNLLTAKPQICGIQDNCPILRKGNFTTETTINHDTVASQPSNQPQVVRTSAEPPSGVESVVDEPPKIFDAPDTKVIEIASKNSTGQKSYGGIDNRAGMTEPHEPVAVFSGTDHAVAILPDQPCWPDDASWQGTNIGWVPTNEVETSAEWTYGGAEWVPPETGPGAPDIQWIQQEGTQFGIDQLQPISSLGSILDSVNQILNTGAGTSGEQVLLNEYGGFSSTLAAGSVMTGELVDLQRAMGATDEEMLMLQKLGEDGWPLENADLMDLDNQRSRTEGGVKEQEEEQEGEETSSPLPAKTSPKKTNQVSSIMMRRQRTEDRPFGHCQNILSQYEQKEMVCPLCNKHFLGLAALQTHVASTHNVREGPDKKMKTYERSRKAMIASIATTTLGQVINHRHMCVWCKELHVDEESLQRHVESTHSSEGSDGQELQATTSTGVKDEGLKSHMSTALGGLLNRALGHVFHTVQNTSILKELSLSNRKQPSEEGGSSRPQTPINSVKEEVVDEAGNKSKELLRRKSQEEDKDKPYSCHMCDVKFLVLSSRNRHIARVHGLGPKPPPEEGVLSDQSEPDFEKTWVDLYPYDWNVDASADGDMIDGSFLCLDCGINFQTPQEVLKHRQLEHNHEPSPEPKETDKCSVTKETSSNADIVGTQEDNEPTSTALPVKTLDVLSEPFFVNVQGNISECSRDTVSPGSLENNSGNKEEPLLPPLQLRTLPSSQLLTMDNHPQQLHPPRAQTPPQTTPQPLLIEKIKCPVTNDRPANKTSSRSIESTSRKLARSKMNVEELERQLCKNDAMIKAKAEAAIRELSLSRKGRSSASSNKWGVHRYKFTVPDRQPGVEGDNKPVPAPEDRYSYPLIRKVSNSRFASLTERMKKQCGKVNPCVAESSPEKEVLDISSSNTGSAAFAVYEFDEEESEPVTELSLRGNGGGTSIIKGLPHQTGNERIKDKENDEEVIVDQETVLWSHENSRTLHGKGTLKRLFKDGLETDRDKEVVVAKKPRKNSECQVSPNKSPGSTGLREYNLDVFEDRGVKRKNTFEELTPRNIIVEKQKSERFENISQTFDAISAVPNFEKESFCSSIEKLGVANLSASPEVNLPFISSKLSSHSNVETPKTILNKAHKKTEIGGGVVKGRHKDKGLSSDQVFDEILKNTVNDKKVKDKPKKQIKLVNLKGNEEHRSKQSYAGEQTRSETSTKKFNTVLDQDLKNKKKDQKNKLAVHSNRPSHKSNNTQNWETLKKGNKRDQEMLTPQENEELKKSRRQVKRVSYAETLDSELEEDLFEDSIVIEDTDTKLKQKVKSSKKRLSMDEKNKRKSDKEFTTEPNTKISTIAALKRSKQKLNYSDDKSEDDSSIDNFDQHKFLASNAKISQKKDKAYSNRFFDNDSVTEDDDTSESDATDKTKKPQQRNTKTDLLKCVFAKSRRNSTTIVSGSGGCVPDVDDNIPNTHNVNVSSGHYSTNVVKHKHRSWQRVTF